MSLPPHHLSIALVHPQIAPNTGNIGRLCVATGTALHIVRPMGFVLDDKQLRRSAMDYWPRLKLTMHDDEESFFGSIDAASVWLFETSGTRSIWDVNYGEHDCLIFGSETSGLNALTLARYADRVIRIPQVKGERCLNLSTSAGIALFEALRQNAGSFEPPMNADEHR